jgi:hypothetical protein
MFINKMNKFLKIGEAHLNYTTNKTQVIYQKKIFYKTVLI